MLFSSKESDNKWKEKAKQRSVENKKLRKRIQEITKSRDDWKNKLENLKIKLKEEKKNFNFFSKELKQNQNDTLL